MRILLTPTSLTPESTHPALERLRATGAELVFNELRRPLTSAELAERLGDVDGVVAGLDDYSAETLAAAGERLRVISRYGAGSDKVDLSAAAARGIPVTTTPGANATAVAELAVGLMFALARRIPLLDRDVRAGGWQRSQGIELTGKTLGIVGVGAIGRGVAKRAQGCEMTVLGYDPMVPAEAMAESGIASRELDALLAESDVVSLHLPLLDSTRHLLDVRRLALLKPGALLINTSRGGLIDEEAVRLALEEGRLGGLALDAYEIEPPTESPLIGHERVISTPHTGAHTAEAVERMAGMAITNLLDVLEGRGSRFEVKAD